MLKKKIAALASWMPDALLLCGAVSIVWGAGLIYAPAGYIVGGALAIGAGYLLARNAV
jgi:hypothetical protein